jgi:hypothetical protein
MNNKSWPLDVVRHANLVIWMWLSAVFSKDATSMDYGQVSASRRLRLRYGLTT